MDHNFVKLVSREMKITVFADDPAQKKLYLDAGYQLEEMTEAEGKRMVKQRMQEMRNAKGRLPNQVKESMAQRRRALDLLDPTSQDYIEGE